MNKRIIIAAPACSGKDYLKNKFIDKGFIPSVSYTTRPKRENENNGTDYHFVSTKEFIEHQMKHEFIEVQSFRGWYYGTPKTDFVFCEIFIMTPQSINLLPKEIRQTSFIIYLDVDESIRIERLNKRNDIDSVERRLMADREMFKDFTDYDLRITDPNF
jgi:guanylate kinase